MRFLRGLGFRSAKKSWLNFRSQWNTRDKEGCSRNCATGAPWNYMAFQLDLKYRNTIVQSTGWYSITFSRRSLCQLEEWKKRTTNRKHPPERVAKVCAPSNNDGKSEEWGNSIEIRKSEQIYLVSSLNKNDGKQAQIVRFLQCLLIYFISDWIEVASSNPIKIAMALEELGLKYEYVVLNVWSLSDTIDRDRKTQMSMEARTTWNDNQTGKSRPLTTEICASLNPAQFSSTWSINMTKTTNYGGLISQPVRFWRVVRISAFKRK